jgi:TonB family protein
VTIFATVEAKHSPRSTRRIWWSVGVHAAILLLCLVVSSIPPTPASAIERPHVTLIAPVTPITPPVAPPAPKKVAAIEAKVQPKAAPPELKPEPAPPPREFVPPVRKAPAPARQQQIEMASVQPLDPIAPVIPTSDPLTPALLPPPPIVVGKLSGASSASAPAQSGTTTTRSAGFSTSNGPAINSEPKTARAAASGFGGAAIASAPSPRASTRTGVLTKPVEILKKPQPVYTEEARALRLEGEVLLEVLFTASAEVRVLRVLRGLGHGLDESAVASASRIEFRPALREGEPTDQTVTVHIRFQLAY